MNLPKLFDIKPVIIRAFIAARDKVKSRHSYGDDYVSRAEFRLLLKYLRQYFEYWIAFDRVDSDQDRRIGFNEFVAAKNIIERWGINMNNPDIMWSEIDTNGGGQVLFDEFCQWAI